MARASNPQVASASPARCMQVTAPAISAAGAAKRACKVAAMIELIMTSTPIIASGTFVCSAIHSGRPIVSRVKWTESIPFRNAAVP